MYVSTSIDVGYTLPMEVLIDYASKMLVGEPESPLDSIQFVFEETRAIMREFGIDYLGNEHLRDCETAHGYPKNQG